MLAAHPFLFIYLFICFCFIYGVVIRVIYYFLPPLSLSYSLLLRGFSRRTTNHLKSGKIKEEKKESRSEWEKNKISFYENSVQFLLLCTFRIDSILCVLFVVVSNGGCYCRSFKICTVLFLNSFFGRFWFTVDIH